LEGKDKESRRSQPEGIDFSCRLLFQSWLENSLLALFQNPRVQKVIQQPIPFSVSYALDIRVAFDASTLMLEAHTVSPSRPAWIS
jgi:hypothetical protein